MFYFIDTLSYFISFDKNLLVCLVLLSYKIVTNLF